MNVGWCDGPNLVSRFLAGQLCNTDSKTEASFEDSNSSFYTAPEFERKPSPFLATPIDTKFCNWSSSEIKESTLNKPNFPVIDLATLTKKAMDNLQDIAKLQEENSRKEITDSINPSEFVAASGLSNPLASSSLISEQDCEILPTNVGLDVVDQAPPPLSRFESSLTDEARVATSSPTFDEDNESCNNLNPVFSTSIVTSRIMDFSTQMVSENSPAKFSTPNKLSSVPNKTKNFHGLSSKYDNHATPVSNLVYNPFDSGLHLLTLPTVSPSIFKSNLSPDSASARNYSGKGFKWSIDQIAVLNPAFIDTPTSQANNEIHYDAAYEKIAQENIDKFFSRKFIVPSPWTDGSINETPTDNNNNQQSFPNSVETLPHIPSGNKVMKTTCSIGCQTELALPPVLPPNLEAMLAEYMKPVPMDEDKENLIRNTSLRRRELFRNDDISSQSSSLNQLPCSTKAKIGHHHQTFNHRTANKFNNVFTTQRIDSTTISNDADPVLSGIGINSIRYNGISGNPKDFKRYSFSPGVSVFSNSPLMSISPIKNPSVSPSLSPIIPSNRCAKDKISTEFLVSGTDQNNNEVLISLIDDASNRNSNNKNSIHGTSNKDNSVDCDFSMDSLNSDTVDINKTLNKSTCNITE